MCSILLFVLDIANEYQKVLRVVKIIEVPQILPSISFNLYYHSAILIPIYPRVKFSDTSPRLLIFVLALLANLVASYQNAYRFQTLNLGE